MKKRIVLGSLLLVAVLVGGITLLRTAPSSATKEKVDTEKTDFLGQPIGSEETVVVKSNPARTQKVEAVDLEKCVPGLKINGQNSYSQILEQLKEKTSAHGEVLESTEYQLEGSQKEEIVVQHIPSEETKNQVRVFKTAADGFPDRIKDFPQASGKVEQRLAGALTLGSLKKKIEKYKAASIARGELTFEKENQNIVRISFSDGRKQLICESPDRNQSEDQSCSCQSF